MSRVPVAVRVGACFTVAVKAAVQGVLSPRLPALGVPRSDRVDRLVVPFLCRAAKAVRGGQLTVVVVIGIGRDVAVPVGDCPGSRGIISARRLVRDALDCISAGILSYARKQAVRVI